MSRGAVTPKGKRFRLAITHRTADQPTQLSTWGRVKGGEVGLVLRANTGQGVLVRQMKGKDAESTVWRCAGPGLEAPGRPTDDLGAVAALELLKSAMKPAPTEGATTLRGQWTGVFVWDDAAQLGRVELTRRLSTYGVLTITSTPDLGWSWTFHRKKKWFTEAGDASGEGFTSLSDAVLAGIEGARGLVAPACSVRDTSRRAAHDAGYAERYPLRAPKPHRDRLAERVTRLEAELDTPTPMPKAKTKKTRKKKDGRSKASGSAGRGRRKGSGKAARKASPAVDQNKDAQLLSLFQDAIASAMEGR